MSEALLFAGLLCVAVGTAAAACQLHGRNDERVELIHVDDGHHPVGGGLTTCHRVLEKDKKGEEKVTKRRCSVISVM